MFVLVLEASTTAAKALLYHDRDGVVAMNTENYGPAIDSGGLHDAEEVVRALLRLGASVARGKDVAAVGMGCVWHSVLGLNEAMTPVTKTHLWNFTGSAETAARFRADESRAHAIYKRTGCMPNATYALYDLLYMRENGLDPAGKFFCSQGAYNFYRLTGEFREARNVVSGMGLLNIETEDYDAEALALCGILPERLGRLATYRDVAPLLPEAAEAMGIRAGIPVVPSHSDGALNQLGNGAMRPGMMTFSVGTSAAIRLTTARPVLSSPPATWCYRGVDGWMSGAATNGACNCVNWFKERLLGDKWSYDELGARLSERGPAPIFLPFLYGERCPGWDDERRGGFERLTGADDVATLFRAVSEGILFNIYQCYRILTELSGEPERIILSGGILNSAKWTQMAADIFGRGMHLSDNPNASMLGAAALALNAAGALDELAGFGIEELAKVEPQTDARAYYQGRFTDYLDLYDKGKANA